MEESIPSQPAAPSPAQPAPRTVLLAGLGNPGREYRDTRHNIGFMVVDALCRQLDVRMTRVQSKALIVQVSYGVHKIILAKPQTYMNLSGQSVAALMRFYRVENTDLLVAHDDIDLPFGSLRMRPGGGSAGQKGVASIIAQLGIQDFPRLRMGVGRPPGQKSAADYVLHGFSPAEQETLQFTLDRAVQAALTFVRAGLQTAMNQFNGNLSVD